MKEELIKRLKMLMAEREITAAELSRRSGIRASSISDYLKEKYEPKQDKIDLIAEALSVSPAWLMGYETKSDYHVDSQDKALMIQVTPAEQQHIKKYRKLSSAGKKEVDHYLDFRLSSEAPRVEKDTEISSS